MAKKAAEKKPAQKKPHCPFCDAEMLAADLPFCQACHVDIVRCEQCLTVLPKGTKACPKCGTKVKKVKTAS